VVSPQLDMDEFSRSVSAISLRCQVHYDADMMKALRSFFKQEIAKRLPNAKLSTGHNGFASNLKLYALCSQPHCVELSKLLWYNSSFSRSEFPQDNACN